MTSSLSAPEEIKPVEPTSDIALEVIRSHLVAGNTFPVPACMLYIAGLVARIDAKRTRAEKAEAERDRAFNDGYASRNAVVDACRSRAETAEADNIALRAKLAERDKEVKRLRKAVAMIDDEARRANEVISLNRDGGGQGRVKVATAMHRIASWARAALASTEKEG